MSKLSNPPRVTRASAGLPSAPKTLMAVAKQAKLDKGVKLPKQVNASPSTVMSESKIFTGPLRKHPNPRKANPASARPYGDKEISHRSPE